MNLIQKIKCILKDEGLSQRQFADLIDVPLGSLEFYLREKREPSHTFLLKITNHSQFQKYTLWLMTGTTAPESGQVCPAFSTQDAQESIKKKA